MNKMILTLLLGIGMVSFSMSQCYGPESFDDLDGNGSWTANESLTDDCNGDGLYDDNTCIVTCEAEFKVNSITNNGDGTYDIGIYFKTTEDMYGYQFNFLSSASGLGDQANALSVDGTSGDETGSNLIVQGTSTILGVSFTGAAIPATVGAGDCTPDVDTDGDGDDSNDNDEWCPLTTITASEVEGASGSVVLNAHNEGTTDGTTFVISGIGGDPLNAEWYDTVWTVGSESISLDNDMINPYSYSLKNNYPNPFNPTTTIEYSIAEISDVNISIYDASGRFVKNLVSGQHVPGDDYQVSWNGTNESGTNVAAGMYFYKINAGSFVETKKMLLIK